MKHTHTSECQARREKAIAERRVYEEKFENFCEHCDGTGWHTWNEPDNFWGAPRSRPESDFCEHCIGDNKCPQCGENLTCPEDDSIITCACGYDSESNCDGLPYVPHDLDCNCIIPYYEEEPQVYPSVLNRAGWDGIM